MAFRTFRLQHVGSSSLIRDRTGPPTLGAWSLSHWTTRGVPASAVSTGKHDEREDKVAFCLCIWFWGFFATVASAWPLISQLSQGRSGAT